MKKYILWVAVTLISFCVKAQGGNSYNSFGLGLGASGVRPYADLKKNEIDLSYNANFTYYYSPYVPVTIEFQLGKLRGGGNNVTEDKDTRRFENSYKALMLHIDYQLGEMIDYERNGFLNIIKNLYVGAGGGFIFNKVDVNRTSKLDPTYTFPGSSSSVNLMVPLRFGYEFKIFDYYGLPKFGISLGYEHNLVFGEGLDGYDDPSIKFKNNALDQYRQVTIGFKYNFGPELAYDKAVRGN